MGPLPAKPLDTFGWSAPPLGLGGAPPPSEPRDTFDTKADSVEIEIDRSPGRVAETTSTETTSAEPSTRELLERAAALGPSRLTWESIVLPADPILDEKRQPHVAERRARLTRLVKITLSACLGVCVLALGISAVSGDPSSSTSGALAGAERTVASTSVVPVEPLDGAKHGKAVRRVAPSATTAAFVRTKRR